MPCYCAVLKNVLNFGTKILLSKHKNYLNTSHFDGFYATKNECLRSKKKIDKSTLFIHSIFIPNSVCWSHSSTHLYIL